MLSSFITVALVAVGSFVAIGLLVSYLKYERLHEAAVRDAAAASPRDLFILRIAERLGRSEARPFAVALVIADAPDTLGALEERLRRHLRRSDDVRRLAEDRLGVIVDAERRFVPFILKRAHSALSAESPALSARFAVAYSGVDGKTAAELLAAAEAAPAGPPPEPLADEPAPIEPEADEFTDPLTGTLKTERLSLATHKFVAKCRRDQQPVSLLYVDVNDLPDIRARHGASVCDAILKACAEILLRRFRESDLVGRLEGGGFLVAGACSPSEAAKAAQRVLDGVREVALPVGASRLHFTVNIGIAGYPDHGGATRVLFDAAERALAAARRRGRNTYAVFSGTEEDALQLGECRARDRF